MTPLDIIADFVEDYPEVPTRDRRARALVVVANRLEEMSHEDSAALLKAILPNVDLKLAYRACADVRQYRRDRERALEVSRSAVDKLYVHEPQHKRVI